MKRRLFLDSVTAGAAIPRIAFGDFTSNLDRKKLPVLDPVLKRFLESTAGVRNVLLDHKADGAMKADAARQLAIIAKDAFEDSAAKGMRRHAFYYGRIFAELERAGDKPYKAQAELWMERADKLNHPGAAYSRIQSYPSNRDPDLLAQYKRAIGLGSVSALAACAQANDMRLINKDWMEEGGAGFGESHIYGFDTWGELFFCWMLIYHFLIRWDKGDQIFRLGLPSAQILEIMAGTLEPSEQLSEKVGFEIIRSLTRKAADEASKMDIDYFPEEIYQPVWHVLFNTV